MQVSYVTRVFDRSFDWLSTSGVRALLIAVGLVVLLALLKRGMSKFRTLYEGTLPGPAEIQRAHTLTQIVRDVARIVTLFVGVMMVLSEVGIDLNPFVAVAWLGRLAIGFGGKSLVKDLISGFFILLENSVRVGDVVEVAVVAGLVEQVELRAIRLRDLFGNVNVVPNGVIDKVKNMS